MTATQHDSDGAVERSLCRHCDGRILRRTDRPGRRWLHDRGEDRMASRGCTDSGDAPDAEPIDLTGEAVAQPPALTGPHGSVPTLTDLVARHGMDLETTPGTTSIGVTVRGWRIEALRYCWEGCETCTCPGWIVLVAPDGHPYDVVCRREVNGLPALAEIVDALIAAASGHITALLHLTPPDPRLPAP